MSSSGNGGEKTASNDAAAGTSAEKPREPEFSVEDWLADLKEESDREDMRDIVNYYLGGTKSQRAHLVPFVRIGIQIASKISGEPRKGSKYAMEYCLELLEKAYNDPSISSPQSRRHLFSIKPEDLMNYDLADMYEFLAKVYTDCRPFRELTKHIRW